MSPKLSRPDFKPKHSRRKAQPTTPAQRAANVRALFEDDRPLIVVLPAILNDSIKDAPIAVMTRIALDWIIRSTPFDQLFEQTAEGQYTREFTLEHLVLVMLDVVCGHHPSARSAFQDRQLWLIASLSAFYGKLNRMELAITEEIVRQTARRCRELIVAGGGLLPEPIPGYAARILDGNVLAGTDHRLIPTRTTWSACLPGKALAIYEPASGRIIDVVLEENAHTQERALLDAIVVRAGELWIADRNFCVRSFLFGIQRNQAFFLVRRHASTLPFKPLGSLKSKGRCPTGEVFEQAILVDDPEAEGVQHRLRRIVLKLDVPTSDGETEIVLVTNLPEEVSAIDCCLAYRGRWRIEGHFQVLTDLLHCEIPSLSHPRAALFAFGMSVTAGNSLAVLKGSLRAEHGVEMAGEVSDHAVVSQVARIYPGMMKAVAPHRWPDLSDRPAEEVAALLNELAVRVPVERMLRKRRGPKKPKPRRSKGERHHHLATKKLLDKAKGVGPPKAKGDATPTASRA
jgi:IS4 transposase